jgi:hypothetical protein
MKYVDRGVRLKLTQDTVTMFIIKKKQREVEDTINKYAYPSLDLKYVAVLRTSIKQFISA